MLKLIIALFATIAIAIMLASIIPTKKPPESEYHLVECNNQVYEISIPANANKALFTTQFCQAVDVNVKQ